MWKFTPENISLYKIAHNKHHQFKAFEYPYHLTDENIKVEKDIFDKWINTNSNLARKKGLWNDLHHKVFDFNKLPCCSTWQQHSKRLDELEAHLKMEK